ncbi:MAG: group 1 truncated hemoglobin [Xanthomonadales bacterium]|nr:group 1 truncated hemoglobin [Xanthomonadales bacterium]
MKLSPGATLGLLLSLAVAFATPTAAQMDPAPAHPELRGVLDDFGGAAGLAGLMDDLMVLMLDNPRLRPFFETIDQRLLKRHLAEQFCVILGGDCSYTGRTMIESHAGLGITRADFNALVEDLQTAMNRRGIPFRAQNRLLAVLAPMHREIVER